MLFSFQGGDAKDSIIGRKVHRPRRNIDLDKVSQVLRGSAGDNLIAETGCFVFDSMFYGERNVPVTPTCLDCFFVVFFSVFFFCVSLMHHEPGPFSKQEFAKKKWFSTVQ